MNPSNSSSEATSKKRKLKCDSKQDLKKVKTSLNDKENCDVDTIEPLWNDYELLSEQQGLDPNISINVIKLFNEGNTIPFIARYRKHVTGNLSPEILRDVKETYEEICCLKSKIKTVVKSVEKLGHSNQQLRKSILSVKTVEELEHIYAPFKPGGKRTLAERAKSLGLEPPATDLLNNTRKIDLLSYVNSSEKELNSLANVEKGIIHIIASVIATDTEMLSFLRTIRSQVNFIIETKKSSAKPETKKKAEKSVDHKSVDETKFQTYFEFKVPVKFLKPHQILAINRGENLKILSVKVVVPDSLQQNFTNFCTGRWLKFGNFDVQRKKIILEAVKDSYSRLVQPLVIREIRSELKQKAEKASYEVFSTNLKHLLLAKPLKGKPILGIDPGYKNGCKLALVSSTGQLLSYNVIYPDKYSNKSVQILKGMLIEHECSLIALGNGTACRQTEEWISESIQNKMFRPLDVTYAIVSEDGASIYSCSSEARKEFPKLDPNIISAVSLARRVQDPLAELVKVEPQHLGVGMYQHDLKKKQLEEALDEVVSECVSFVGVDLNTTSQCLLRRISGLSDKRAASIIEHRTKCGQFTHRKQLTEVKGIGARVFQQCAGFLRVGPANAEEAENFYKQSNTTKLDCTYIHPESYKITLNLLKKFKLKENDIGTENFISNMKMINANISELSSELKSSDETIKLILETLCKPLNHDLRNDCAQITLFKKGLTSIYDIHIGTVLTGRVNNVTHFGCFVDIGVGKHGLIHSSKLKGLNLQIGDRVEVSVTNLEIDKGRIGLEAIKKL